MRKQNFGLFRLAECSLAIAITLLSVSARTNAQCSQVISGLRTPLGITQSNLDNLLVSESGLFSMNHTGRISILETDGDRRTLIDGLPSANNDVNEPSGPAGIFMRGRTLYVAIGVGNSVLPGPFLGAGIGNPTPASPLFSSVLAVHFSAEVERTTTGFTLTVADQATLAAGEKVILFDSDGAALTIELVVNFLPDFTPKPLPTFQANVGGSNPFDLVVVGDQLYVTDGGQNTLRQVDIPTGAFSTLATFAPIPNLTGIGGPVIEAVPTGIRYVDGQLLVAIFRGVPFPPGTSQIVAVDPTTGAQTPLITGRKTAIDVLALSENGDTDYLVLQHASAGFFFGTPGQVLRFENVTDPPAITASCLTRPTSMVLDEKTNTLYVTELGTPTAPGRVIALPIL